MPCRAGGCLLVPALPSPGLARHRVLLFSSLLPYPTARCLLACPGPHPTGPAPSAPTLLLLLQRRCQPREEGACGTLPPAQSPERMALGGPPHIPAPQLGPRRLLQGPRAPPSSARAPPRPRRQVRLEGPSRAAEGQREGHSGAGAARARARTGARAPLAACAPRTAAVPCPCEAWCRCCLPTASALSLPKLRPRGHPRAPGPRPGMAHCAECRGEGLLRRGRDHRPRPPAPPRSSRACSGLGLGSARECSRLPAAPGAWECSGSRACGGGRRLDSGGRSAMAERRGADRGASSAPRRAGLARRRICRPAPHANAMRSRKRTASSLCWQHPLGSRRPREGRQGGNARRKRGGRRGAREGSARTCS